MAQDVPTTSNIISGHASSDSSCNPLNLPAQPALLFSSAQANQVPHSPLIRAGRILSNVEPSSVGKRVDSFDEAVRRVSDLVDVVGLAQKDEAVPSVPNYQIKPR